MKTRTLRSSWPHLSPAAWALLGLGLLIVASWVAVFMGCPRWFPE